MRIEKILFKDVDMKMYQELFIEAFGAYEPHYPHFVYFGYNQYKVIGFAACFEISPDLVGVQHIGFAKDVDQGEKYELYLNAILYLHEKYKKIMGIIRASNTKALVWGLKSGFKIIGVKFLKNEFLIEVMREA